MNRSDYVDVPRILRRQRCVEKLILVAGYHERAGDLAAAVEAMRVALVLRDDWPHRVTRATEERVDGQLAMLRAQAASARGQCALWHGATFVPGQPTPNHRSMS